MKQMYDCQNTPPNGRKSKILIFRLLNNKPIFLSMDLLIGKKTPKIYQKRALQHLSEKKPKPEV
jgi:hypothetical protein